MTYTWKQSLLASVVSVDIDELGFILNKRSNIVRIPLADILKIRFYGPPKTSHPIFSLKIDTANAAHSIGVSLLWFDPRKIQPFVNAAGEILRRYANHFPDRMIDLSLSRKGKIIALAIMIAIFAVVLAKNPRDFGFTESILYLFVLAAALLYGWFRNPFMKGPKEISPDQLADYLEELVQQEG